MKKGQVLGLSEEGFHRIAYTEWGERGSTNTPILCAHGLTRNGRDFDSLAAFLASKGCHVFCPDVVGRGDSDWLKNPLHYTYEQYIHDMTVMLARINTPTLDWIGTSMGGLIGMYIASLPNTPIRRLVLNDVGAEIPVKALSRIAKYAGKEPEFSNIEEAKRYFKMIYNEFGSLTDDQWQSFTENSIKEISANKFAVKTDHNVKRSTPKSKIAWQLLYSPHKALEGTLFDIDLWHIWRKVKCPVLVIRGSRSDLLLPKTIEKMRAIHPGMDAIEIPNTGHAPALMDAQHQEVIFRWLMKPR